VRRLIEAAHPDLAVLSHPELAPEIRVEVLARISPQAEVA
jgi:type III secretory pathway component EscV